MKCHMLAWETKFEKKELCHISPSTLPKGWRTNRKRKSSQLLQITKAEQQHGLGHTSQLYLSSPDFLQRGSVISIHREGFVEWKHSAQFH